MKKLITSCLLYIIISLLHVSLMSQELILSNVPVSIDSKELENPYLGGIIAGQFSNADIDQDGLEDLVVFDRLGGTVSVLINDGEQYSFDPSFSGIFPPATNWMTFRDYNNDGIKDIFCNPTSISLPGVEVWTGVIKDGELTYELVENPDRDFDILYIPLGNGFTQIFVSVIDLPEIKDIDNDGDMDILAFEPAGSYVFYYQNMAVERGLGPDALEFRLGDQCYGKFFESGFSEAIDLSSNGEDCANFNSIPNDNIQTRHSGSTILSIDIDKNGLYDVLLGDISYDGLVQLSNNGTADEAWMTDQILRFPDAETPVEMEIFLSAFEVNYQNENQIIVTSNDKISGQTEHFVRRLENGDKGYELVDSNFLISDMIFHGRHSRPIFFDGDGDGLIDILIGSSGTSSFGGAPNARLVFYKNIGTALSPSYTLQDPDFLSFSQFGETSRWLAPADGDIDGDGDIDLIVGDDAGFLYLVENQSGLPDRFLWKQPVYGAYDIRVSAFATPTIFDFNNDGLGDLIVGEQNFNSSDGRLGSFNYFQNVGTLESSNFSPDENMIPNDPAFGNIFMRDDRFVSNFSAAGIHNNGEQIQLIVANEAGSLFYYEDVSESQVQDSFELTALLSEVYVGHRATPDIDDIDGDGFLEMLVGNSRGGATLYETDLVSNEKINNTNGQDISFEANISPNPVRHLFSIRTDLDEYFWKLYDLKGMIVRIGDQNVGQVDVTNLPSATYILELFNDDYKESIKVIKQ